MGFKHHPRDKKIRTIGLALISGSEAAAKTEGLPERTVRQWMTNRDKIMGDVELASLIPQKTREALDKAVLSAIEATYEEIEAVRNNPKHKATPFGAQKLATAAGILADKAELMNGRPTSRRFGYSVQEHRSSAPRPDLSQLIEGIASPLDKEDE